MSFIDDALGVIRSQFPDYNIGHTDGRWVARFTADLLAPIIDAGTPEELTQLLTADLATRQAGGDGA